MEKPCVGIVFNCEWNPKFLPIIQDSTRLANIQKEYLFPAAAQWWPQRGARERLREPRAKGSVTEQGRGTGRGRAHVDHSRGEGHQADPANQRCPPRAQPLPEGALTGLLFTLLFTRGFGRGVLTPRVAADRPQAWSRSYCFCSLCFYCGSFGLVFGETCQLSLQLA